MDTLVSKKNGGISLMVSDVYVCEISCCVVLSIEICAHANASTNIGRIDGICLCNVVVGSGIRCTATSSSIRTPQS